jgi:hypothetical protein
MGITRANTKITVYYCRVCDSFTLERPKECFGKLHGYQSFEIDIAMFFTRKKDESLKEYNPDYDKVKFIIGNGLDDLVTLILDFKQHDCW